MEVIYTYFFQGYEIGKKSTGCAGKVAWLEKVYSIKSG